ncbi:MAG TPA: MFS transporter [Stellaceae bacterium]|nr:MFS transporter [Stellaceae bacterium]
MDTLDSPRGWRVVGGTHAVIAVSFGSAYAFSPLFPSLATEFGAPRGQIALVFSLAAFTYYVMGAVAGPLGDRWPTRRLVAAGLIAMIVGSVGASQAGSLAVLYAWYGIGVGLGIGLAYVPAIGAVQSWFERRRSQASGVATAGIGIGTLILPFAVGQAVPVIGWRSCLIGLAAVIAVIGLPAALIIRKRVVPSTWKTAGAHDALTPSAAWRDGKFRRFYAVLLLGSFCTFIPYVHIVPAARDLGLSIEAGTVLIGLIGIGNVFGRFVLAGLGDRIGRTRLLAVLTLAVAASFVFWAMATFSPMAGGFVMLAIFAALFGMSYGGCVGLYPAVAADLFGTKSIGSVLGYLYTAVGVAALIGPPLAGYIFDITGSYLGPIIASAIAAACAGWLTFGLRRSAPQDS